MSETRKLAAILCSDVVGYSRLAGADEDRVLARLRALRSDLIDPTIAVHHGRVVKRTGDGTIVEFRSVVDAVRARALLLRPSLLLLDEPSFGLAPLIVADIFRILQAINQTDRVSLLIVEQNANMALDLADRAYLIETGRVVIGGAAATTRNDDSVRRAYLGY
jgi:ABC-type Na+ transport system ATPase subunit NatA